MRIVRYSLLSAAICLLLSAAPAYVQAASDGIAGSGDILSKYEDWIERRRQAAEETEADEEMVTDEEAVCAFEYLAKTEGIIPAIESAHAIAHAIKIAPTMDKDKIIVITVSGRGDKDCAAIARYRGEEGIHE